MDVGVIRMALGWNLNMGERNALALLYEFFCDYQELSQNFCLCIRR
jgi:hypothetical protein